MLARVTGDGQDGFSLGSTSFGSIIGQVSDLEPVDDLLSSLLDPFLEALLSHSPEVLNEPIVWHSNSSVGVDVVVCFSMNASCHHIVNVVVPAMGTENQPESNRRRLLGVNIDLAEPARYDEPSSSTHPTEGSHPLIRMAELVEDPFYNEFLDRPPLVPDDRDRKASFRLKPWVVYVRRHADGKWGKREFWSYKKALKFLRYALKLGVYDAALNNRRYWSAPPNRIVRVRGKYVQNSRGKTVQATKLVEWKPRTELLLEEEEHDWCGYCRRPTVYRHFGKHRMLGNVSPMIDRCSICGASRRIGPTYKNRRF